MTLKAYSWRNQSPCWQNRERLAVTAPRSSVPAWTKYQFTNSPSNYEVPKAFWFQFKPTLVGHEPTRSQYDSAYYRDKPID
jgi:hypothetical protein